jgi:hypothetical protein
MARADDGVRLVLRRQTYRREKGLFGCDGYDTDKRRHVRHDPQVLLLFKKIKNGLAGFFMDFFFLSAAIWSLWW